jgi:K+/H+ antiporter YhaU regulatory subunit KhtT
MSNLWEKIKTGFGVGVEKVSEKTEELSILAKLNWERFKIQKSIEKEFNKLGGKVFQLHVDNREKELTNETKDIVQKLNTLEGQLQAKIEEIKEVSDKGEIDKRHLKEFKRDLELGDGTIEQLVIEENCKLAGKKLKEIKFPENVLLGAIVRKEKVVIPDGNTIIQIGDKVTLLGEKDDVREAIKIIGDK